jgi:Spy/CpxP family protein refolding chaperone
MVRQKRIKEFRSFSTPEKFIERFEMMLELTDDQKDKIYPIIEKYAKENRNIRVEYREEFKKLMRSYREELEPLLTKEQVEKLKEKSWEHRNRDRRHGGPPEKAPDSGDRHDRRSHKEPFFFP